MEIHKRTEVGVIIISKSPSDKPNLIKTIKSCPVEFRVIIYTTYKFYYPRKDLFVSRYGKDYMNWVAEDINSDFIVFLNPGDIFYDVQFPINFNEAVLFFPKFSGKELWKDWLGENIYPKEHIGLFFSREYLKKTDLSNWDGFLKELLDFELKNDIAYQCIERQVLIKINYE